MAFRLNVLHRISLWIQPNDSCLLPFICELFYKVWGIRLIESTYLKESTSQIKVREMKLFVKLKWFNVLYRISYGSSRMMLFSSFYQVFVSVLPGLRY